VIETKAQLTAMLNHIQETFKSTETKENRLELGKYKRYGWKAQDVLARKTQIYLDA
jgi:hypothetical protein